MGHGGMGQGLDGMAMDGDEWKWHRDEMGWLMCPLRSI